MQAREELLTPELAGKYLENAAENRSISQTHVQFLAKDMREGRWRLTHQGIAFNEEGKLTDGHHRCWAVIESGASIKTLVTHGLSRTAMDSVDCGRKRSFTDYQVLSGNKKVTHSHEATLRGMFLLQNGKKSYTSISQGETVCYVMELFGNGHTSSFQRGTNNAAVRAAVARASYTRPHDRLEQFVNVLKTGVMLVPGDEVVVKLRNTLLAVNGRYIFESCYRKTERALLSFFERQTLKKIYEAQEELFPIPEDANWKPSMLTEHRHD